MGMHFVYLDEFGHVGPFVSRFDPKYKDSPVFGLAGIILPEAAIRPFATKFLQLKEYMFGAEIQRSGRISSLWEKHGTNIFTENAMAKYPEVRRGGFRLINYIRNSGGHIFYYGREKIVGPDGGNPNGLYKTVLGHAIRQLENYAENVDRGYIIVVDEHSARKELLVTAVKTMYGHTPARHLVSPPFEVESYVNQNVQAADWIAAIVGQLWRYQLRPDEYRGHELFDRYFWTRIHQVATHSTVWRRRFAQTVAAEVIVHTESETALAAAFKTAVELKVVRS